ncbi:polysaccharide deacetylase family protein [uncultured Merdimonas sp.]|uniref:polysaccharide deacetylase family protein n=1 Tax=uncultured Merdimonas sp. TaxID=2023269 RepID=UPI003207C7A3
MNSKKSRWIRRRRKRARQRLLFLFSACFCLLAAGALYLAYTLTRPATIELRAENANIIQGETLPASLSASVKLSGNERALLRWKGFYTAGDLLKELKSGKDYTVSCQADPNTEGEYPIQITLSDSLKDKLQSRDFKKRLNLSVKEGVFTVKNPIGEWEDNRFRKYDGTYVTNDFVVSKNQTYYFNQDGAMVTGWQTINNATYHFNEEGAMETSTWADGDNARYYLGENGAALTGWQDLDGSTYYFDANGKMATGDIYLGLTRCSFDENGKLISKTKSQIDPNKPAIALTFDDGPGPRTMELLAQLEKYNAHATFFMLGQKVSSYPDAIRKMQEIGCELGNHSYDHPDLSKLDAAGIQSQISQTNEGIRGIAGNGATVLRPPYGAISSTLSSNAGMPMILWNIDTLDWKTRNAQSTIDAVMKDVKDGDIILMHDIHSETIDAALQLIPKLQAEGYQLVTVSELAASKGKTLLNGETYTDF